MEWSDDWRTELEETDPKAFDRFSECKATKMDFIKMCSLMWKYNPQRSKEDCFDRMCEWMCSNNQFFVLNITNYKWYLDRIKKQLTTIT